MFHHHILSFWSPHSCARTKTKTNPKTKVFVCSAWSLWRMMWRINRVSVLWYIEESVRLPCISSRTRFWFVSALSSWYVNRLLVYGSLLYTITTCLLLRRKEYREIGWWLCKEKTPIIVIRRHAVPKKYYDIPPWLSATKPPFIFYSSTLSYFQATQLSVLYSFLANIFAKKLSCLAIKLKFFSDCKGIFIYGKHSVRNQGEKKAM